MKEKAIECLNCGIIMSWIPMLVCTQCGSNNVVEATFDPMDPNGDLVDEERGDDE